jgi:fructose-bisphosphate aldolase class 1
MNVEKESREAFRKFLLNKKIKPLTKLFILYQETFNKDKQDKNEMKKMIDLFCKELEISNQEFISLVVDLFKEEKSKES